MAVAAVPQALWTAFVVTRSLYSSQGEAEYPWGHGQSPRPLLQLQAASCPGVVAGTDHKLLPGAGYSAWCDH